MVLESTVKRIRFKTICYLGYSLLVLVIATAMLVMGIMLSTEQREILESAEVVRQLSESFAQFRVLEARRQSSLLAYLTNGDHASLHEYEEFEQRILEVSLQLVRLATRFQDHDLSGRIGQILRLDRVWVRTVAEPIVAHREVGGFGAPPRELVDRHGEISGQLDEELAELDASIVRTLEGYIDERSSSTRRARMYFVAVIFAVLIAGGIAIWLVGITIERPLVALNRFTQLVVSGESMEPPRPTGVYELHELFDNFGTMVRSLRDRERQLLASQANTARSNQDLLFITEYAQFLQQARGEEEIGAALVRQVRRISHAGQIGLYLRHRMNPSFELLASYPPVESEELKLAHAIVPEHCSVVHSHHALQVLDSFSELSASCQSGCAHCRSEFCVPLSARGEVIGMLHLASDAPVSWSREIIEMVTTLVNFTAPTVSNLRHMENMWERATRDPLTTLFNRRYLEEYLPMALESARREQQSLAVLLADIDHFKAINDSSGHDAGDRILRLLGQTMRDSVRASDVVCRYGGEEFLVVLPRADETGALGIAEKIRRRVAERCRRDPSRESGDPVTVSIGVAVFPMHGEEATELIKAADLALYRAKAMGRDAAVLFQAAHEAAPRAAAAASAHP